MTILIKATTLAATASVMALSVITAMPIIDNLTSMAVNEQVLSETEINSLRLFQNDLDTLSEIQGIDKFDLQLDEIISIKDSGSISEAVGKFDNIMIKLNTDIRFKDNFCKDIDNMTVSQVNNYLSSNISEHKKELIRVCIK